jgi:hypothetical protein
MGKKPAVPLIVFALTATCLAGCSRRKLIDRDEARSAIRSARSFAAESVAFIDFAVEGRATHHFAEAHAAYLQNEVERSAKELESAVAEPAAAASVSDCRMQFYQVVAELSDIRAALDDDDKDRLLASKARMEQIRENLEKANPYP